MNQLFKALSLILAINVFANSQSKATKLIPGCGENNQACISFIKELARSGKHISLKSLTYLIELLSSTKKHIDETHDLNINEETLKELFSKTIEIIKSNVYLATKNPQITIYVISAIILITLLRKRLIQTVDGAKYVSEKIAQTMITIPTIAAKAGILTASFSGIAAYKTIKTGYAIACQPLAYGIACASWILGY